MHRCPLSSAVLLIAASCLAAGASAKVSATPSSLMTTTQLPRNVVPVHYAVSITADAEAAAFAANATITLDIVQETTSITLNAADSSFGHATLKGASGTSASVKTATTEASHIDVNAAAQTNRMDSSSP